MKKKFFLCTLFLSMFSRLHTNVILLADGPEINPLVEKLCDSPHVHKLYIAANSYPIQYDHPKIEYLSLSSRDIYSVSKFAIQEKIDFIIANNADALKNGIVNLSQHLSYHCFGALQKSLFLEDSYTLSRTFAAECGIFCIPYALCTSKEEAQKLVTYHRYPLIIKTDNQSSHKKSSLFYSLQESLTWIEEWFSYPHSNKKLIIEEFLSGEKTEIMILTDGTTILPLVYCNTESLIFRNLLNTQPLFFDEYIDRDKIITKIIEPLFAGLKNKFGITYKGILHVSCIMYNGEPMLLGFKCRFKNPETTYLMNHIKTDIYQLLKNSLTGSLEEQKLEWDHRSNMEIILEKI